MQSATLKGVPPEVLKQREVAPTYHNLSIPTKRVHLKDSDHKESVVINAADFDPMQHEELTDEDTKKEQAEQLGTEKPGDPVSTYKIYKSFTYDGLYFEKNGEVKLRKSVAKAISSRFRCIWPSSESAKVDESPTLRDQLLRGMGGEIEERDPK